MNDYNDNLLGGQLKNYPLGNIIPNGFFISQRIYLFGCNYSEQGVETTSLRE